MYMCKPHFLKSHSRFRRHISATPSFPAILITGANRGLGLAIIRALAICAPESILCMGTRSLDSGAQALRKLRQQGLKSDVELVERDVTEDDSIRIAVEFLHYKYGKIDVLIKNAAIACNPKPDLTDFRDVLNSVLSTNVTSGGLVTSLCLPLLSVSEEPRVINVSSARASMILQTSGKLPATASIPYSISKTGLNVLTLEIARLHKNIRFYCASPGHCRTALNGFAGKNDPQEGAKVIVELAVSEGSHFDPGFWELENGIMSCVPW